MAGFKKSLFGFNREDVINYIEKNHRKFSEIEESLKAEISVLKSELSKTLEEKEKLNTEKQQLDKKLQEFNAKYEEIERLSENIGKLYLVAQTNAEAIIENTESSAKLITDEVNRNLYTIGEAHQSLAELRNNIAVTSKGFVDEVDSLMKSLNDTRRQIEDNSKNAADAKDEFNKVYSSIVE